VLHRLVEGGGGERVVLVHGFTQTLRSWDQVVDGLGEGTQVVRVELPGHGGSADHRLGFAEAAAAVGDAGGRATYVGYSMGGRLCLRLALDRPDLVTALVLVGASPGLADDPEREARREADHDLATEIEADGTAAFLERWLAQPLFARLRPSDEELAARRSNPPAGLASALRLLGTGAQEPLWDRLDQLIVPVLLVVGERDRKFLDIARRMIDLITSPTELVIATGAGHAVHLEQPGLLAAAIRDLVEHQAR
jgi:2-succinyl-6-hydroxy-2,4-cyclohexadiene-1-carboxylate synthase